jgi:isopropylmalate/homocitrate/citramalate synthase
MPLDRSKIWTGTLNEVVLSPRKQTHVGLYDTTLRDGEQSVGVVFEPEHKLEIAHLLDEMGVDRIEAGFPRVSQEDERAVKLLVAAGLKAQIWGFSRAVPDDIKAIAELGLQWTIIEAPISDLKLRAFGMSRNEVLRKITDAVSLASREGIRVAFFGVDGTRADLEFLHQAYKAAIDAGAIELVVVDTVGIAGPEAVAYLVKRTVDWFGPQIPVHFHGHNDFGLATASAIAAVGAGASWIHGTVDGIGERAGNADLAQVALALGAIYGVETKLRLDLARKVSSRLRAIAGYQLEPWKPIVGENLFVRETGAVTAQFHLPEAIEPYSSALVDTPRTVVLGKKSGLASIRIKCDELNLKVPEDKYGELLTVVKKLGASKRGLLTDSEFRALVERMGQGTNLHSRPYDIGQTA